MSPLHLEHRHFVFLAEALAGSQPDRQSPAWEGWERAVTGLRDALRSTNPHFDGGRFWMAATGEPVGRDRCGS